MGGVGGFVHWKFSPNYHALNGGNYVQITHLKSEKWGARLVGARPLGLSRLGLGAFTVGNIPQVAAYSESTTTCGPPTSSVARLGRPSGQSRKYLTRSSLNGYYPVLRERDMEFLPAYVTNAHQRREGRLWWRITPPRQDGFSVERDKRERQVLLRLGAAAGGFLECGVSPVNRVVRLLAFENLLDGENLQAWIGAAVS